MKMFIASFLAAAAVPAAAASSAAAAMPRPASLCACEIFAIC